jgi:transcription elongation factor Elf1
MNHYTWKNFSEEQYKKQYGCPHCGCLHYSTEIDSCNYSKTKDTICYCYGCGREFDFKDTCYI